MSESPEPVDPVADQQEHDQLDDESPAAAGESSAAAAAPSATPAPTEAHEDVVSALSTCL